VKFTRYFEAVRRRADRAIIREEWIERAIRSPFRDVPVAETRDLDENTLLDVDAQGNICSITIEHASQRAGAPQFSYEQIAA